ncbi:PREDICTED: uncharacterized protein LOC109172940 [Ipomoea nil]|uniref:uncharacterized protein LOC109172940 n=1 Tax=Ipomoea nil TaxID=35883 RepID=UPI000900C8A0|nr:PREDICTED: uncharacterized protein LOC109172940 [Ipomoea nil]
MESVRVRLNYDNCLTVEATRRSGGLALLWNGGLDVEVVGYSNHYIDTVITQRGSRWRFTGFYGCPKWNQRYTSWNTLRYLSSLNDLPWVLMGDLNDILDAREKLGRVPHPQWLIRGFREAVRASGLYDFPFEGYQFTWDRGRGTSNWVREKLDRILVSGNWQDLFPGARAWSVEGSNSDHMPLLLKTNTLGRQGFRRRPRFGNSWGSIPECREVVESAWVSLDGFPIEDRLVGCGRRVWEWGKNQTRREVREIENCRVRMGSLRGAVDSEGMREFGEYQRKYFQLQHSYCDRLRQRAKEWWLVIDCVQHRISHDQNATLEKPINSDEVRAAVFSMHPDKSPGPDGLSPAFFQLHWDILGTEVVSFCHNFLTSGQLPASVNETHIVLIPKTKHPELMSEFRPISLCNVLYRILAKVLANRLRGVLDSIISNAQSAFIPGRSIVDNVLIAFESTHSLNRKRGSKGGFCALKVDMSKAYDRVEWGFLCQVLKKMGFGERWVGWMRECVSSVQYNVLIEGREWGPIVPERGLRQGDPLSPCLFIIVAESLSAMLRVQEGEGVFHGISVARHAPTISHLFFADDCLFFFRANSFEARILRDVLEEYGGASGQHVNYAKTSILFGNNVHREDKEAVCETLGIHEQQGRGRYLGLPGFVGRRKKEILGFIKDKVRARIMHWGNHFLSRAGRETLLKTVLQSIPNYAMNVFLLPKGLCEDIERLMNSFWWGCEGKGGKGIRWSAWGELCKPKLYGGMGFRRVREMNLAMLGKQGWKFLNNPNALVTRVFKARYFLKCSFLEAGVGSNPSFVWSSVRETQGLLRGGVRWRIGDGGTVKVWGDPWLPDVHNPYVMTTEQSYLNDPLVKSLFCVGEMKWDSELINDIFDQRDAKLILNLPLPAESEYDLLYWGGEINGLYSVKSAYKLAFGNLSQEQKLPWAAVWNLNLPPKIKCFFWAMCAMKLPTKDALIVKQVACDPTCQLCGDEPETAIHLVANCSFTHACWNEIATGWNMGWAGSVGLWVQELWNELPTAMVEKVVTIAWAIWENRNSMVWKSQCKDPRTMVRMALSYVRDWQTAQSQNTTRTQNMAIQAHHTAWSPPPPHYLKINIDVAMDFEHCRMGYGWILRDAAGVVKGAATSTIQGIYSVREAEAIGAREALSWIKNKGWSQVVLETDAQVVTNAVVADQNFTPFGMIIAEVRALLEHLPLVRFVFTKRNANVSAHLLAKYALCNSGEGVIEYFDFIPYFLSSSVLADMSGLRN